MSKKEFNRIKKRIERKMEKSLAPETLSSQAIEPSALEQMESTPQGPMILFIVKLGFTRKTVQQQIVDARGIVEDMTGNLNFPTPTPALADVTTAIDALEVAQNNMRSTINGKTVRDQRRKELVALMKRLQSYVDFASGGDPAIAETSGMLVNNPKTPVGILPATEWVRVRQGAAAGSIELKWKSVAKSSGYRIEVTLNASEGWPLVYEAEKASMTITGLTPGERYTIRIATLSHAGYEGYSQPISIRLNFMQE